MKTSREPDRKKRQYTDLLFLLTIGVLLGFSACAAILHIGGFEQSQLSSLVRMFVVIAILRVLLSNKYLIGLSTALFVLGLLSLAFGALTSPPEPRLVNEAADFVVRVVRYVGGYGYYNTLYEQTFIWFLCSLIGLLIVWFVYLRPNFFVIFAVFALIFGFLISYFPFSDYFLFYIFIFCILTFLIKELSHSCAKQTGKGGFFLRLALPLALLCAGLAAFIPIPPQDTAQPMQTNFIDSIRRMGDRLSLDPSSHYFGIQQAGFGGSDSRQLGGDVALNDELFMRIRTNALQPIYLTGVIMDTYTGSGWENRLTEHVPLDFDELLPNLALYEYFTFQIYHSFNRDEYMTAPDSTVTDLRAVIYIDASFPEQTILIGGMDRRLHTVFHTGLVQDFESHNTALTLLQEQSGQLVSRELIPRNVWYTLTYLTLGEAPQSMMRSSSYRGILQELSTQFEEGRLLEYSLAQGEQEMDFQFILQNYLIPRADWIHETYTALPDEFPARIGEHARSITEGAESNYHRARLLENYLRTEFVYSLTPGTPPTDRDFVDYFLFDARIGYCTYFASAFVTMARSLDLPARYIEGFLASGAPDEDGFIHVLNSMGHAWAEVYLEGYGWLRFDPTPPDSTPTLPAENDTDIHEEPPMEIPEDQPALEVSNLPPVGESQTRPDVVTEEAAQIRLWMVPIFVIALLLLLLTFRVIWVRIREAKIARYDAREAVYHYFSVLLHDLKLLGLTMQPTETVFQFYERVQRTLGSSSEVFFPKRLAKLYTKARYGGEPISPDDRAHMELEVCQIAIAIQSHVGKWRYLLYKYILPR